MRRLMHYSYNRHTRSQPARDCDDQNDALQTASAVQDPVVYLQVPLCLSRNDSGSLVPATAHLKF